MYPGEQPRLGETGASKGGYVLPDSVHCTSDRIKGQEYAWSSKGMHAFVGERTYTHTCDQAYIERHDEQQATQHEQRATSAPSCNSRPNIKMYYSTNGHITFRLPGNQTQRPDLPITQVLPTCNRGGYVLPDSVHCAFDRINGQEYVWSSKGMHVFVGKRTYIHKAIK